MASFIEDCLHALHRLSKQPLSSSREQIEVVIEDIKRVFQDDIPDKDLDLICSLLFDKDKGILCFLQDTAASEELQNGKTNALDFLAAFTDRVERKIVPFVLPLKEISFSLFRRDRFAKVKNAAIFLLVKVLKVASISSFVDDLKIDDLIQKFLFELTKASKHPASVKASIYNVLGVIAELHPVEMDPYAKRLVGLYVSALKSELTSKTRKPELNIVAACFDGLTAFMLNFSQSAEEDSKYSAEIFKYLGMAIDPQVAYTRYEVPRAGLKLITRHAEQFKPYLLSDYQGLYDKLNYWSRHHNRDLLHLGLNALSSFLKEICTALVERAEEGIKEGAVFKFFLLKFRSIMKDKDSSLKQVSMAVTGYGMLAAPCRSFLSEADTQFMLSEVIGMCEHQFFSSAVDLEEGFQSLPNYLKALASIIRQMDTVRSLHLNLTLSMLRTPKSLKTCRVLIPDKSEFQ